MLVWLLHVARYGSSDAVTGLPFDLSGRPHFLLRPCLLTHVEHGAPFLYDADNLTLGGLDTQGLAVLAASNGGVQNRVVNNFIK